LRKYFVDALNVPWERIEKACGKLVQSSKLNEYLRISTSFLANRNKVLKRHKRETLKIEKQMDICSKQRYLKLEQELEALKQNHEEELLDICPANLVSFLNRVQVHIRPLELFIYR